MSFVFNPLEIAIGVSVIATIGLTLYYLMTSGKLRKTVTFLMPGERRGVELRVTKETDFGLYTKPSESVTRRFIKLARGYTIKRGRNQHVTFFGLEGTIFTAAPGRISLKRSLAETLKFIWGEPFVSKFQAQNGRWSRREILE